MARSKTNLYQQDLALWLADTVQQLRAEALCDLDVEHLIEELEGLAGRDRSELHSNAAMSKALKTIAAGKSRCESSKSVCGVC